MNGLQKAQPITTPGTEKWSPYSGVAQPHGKSGSLADGNQHGIGTRGGSGAGARLRQQCGGGAGPESAPGRAAGERAWRRGRQGISVVARTELILLTVAKGSLVASSRMCAGQFAHQASRRSYD